MQLGIESISNAPRRRGTGGVRAGRHRRVPDQPQAHRGRQRRPLARRRPGQVAPTRPEHLPMGVRSSLSVDDQAGECAALTAGNLGEPTFPLRAPQILRVRTSTYLRRAGMQQTASEGHLHAGHAAGGEPERDLTTEVSRAVEGTLGGWTSKLSLTRSRSVTRSRESQRTGEILTPERHDAAVRPLAPRPRPADRGARSRRCRRGRTTCRS